MNKEIQASIGAVEHNYSERGKIFVKTYIDGDRWFMTDSEADIFALDSSLLIFGVKGKEGESTSTKILLMVMG